jgi:hypothetical protein
VVRGADLGGGLVMCRVQADPDRRPPDRVPCSLQGFYHVTYDGNELCECARVAEEARLREIVRARGRA